MSNLPKMLSKREIELEELEEEKYVQSLRDDIEKLQEQLNTAKKALTEISELSDPLDNDTLMSVVANVAGDALAAIGGDGD
ncbi:hypothetical protein [Lactococcus lactis]|uniref:hypothetical protein n=1 Tax=Lactococcus lactis TaxID=1358 RepID=UPI0022E3C2EC|nr:hypothetical protein [Lactococcus lactis]